MVLITKGVTKIVVDIWRGNEKTFWSWKIRSPVYSSITLCLPLAVSTLAHTLLSQNERLLQVLSGKMGQVMLSPNWGKKVKENNQRRNLSKACGVEGKAGENWERGFESEKKSQEDWERGELGTVGDDLGNCLHCLFHREDVSNF